MIEAKEFSGKECEIMMGRGWAIHVRTEEGGHPYWPGNQISGVQRSDHSFPRRHICKLNMSNKSSLLLFIRPSSLNFQVSVGE